MNGAEYLSLKMSFNHFIGSFRRNSSLKRKSFLPFIHLNLDISIEREKTLLPSEIKNYSDGSALQR